MQIIPGIIASSYPRASTAFESIATATGTGSSGTITFSSIPSTYKHLQLRWTAKSDDTAGTGTIALSVALNSDTGTNYANHYFYGDGAAVTASGSASQTSLTIFGGVWRATTATNTQAVGILDILDYASTSKNKTLRTISGGDGNTGNAAGRIFLTSNLWISTSALNSISLTANSGNFTTSTQFALYGIKGA